MKTFSLSLRIALALSVVSLGSATAQNAFRVPTGGGEYPIEKSACLSPQEQIQISARLQRSVQDLKANGILPANWGQPLGNEQRKGAAGGFIWPLQQKAGWGYNSIYGISNFVDLNAAYPNQVLDWNCGSRTYDDNSGYNHAGTDIFLWPFPQYMQDQNGAEIISAAAGVIIAKDDGNPDHSCAMNGQPWNAVYIGNTDGTICWYGHMKTNSQTPKSVGQSVAQGEFLGVAGSSGNSTGPHLHFEVHDGNGNILDPYSGPCASSSASLWSSQKPYSEPTVNALLTHSAPPVFPTCPTMETLNTQDTFHVGDPIICAAYFHDQDIVQASYEVKHVSTGTLAHQWTFSPSVSQLYLASYWYWTVTAPSQPTGAWAFNISYKGTTVTHPFYVADPAAVPDLSGNASAVRIAPNPSKGIFSITGLPASSSPYIVRITDLLGRTLFCEPRPATASPITVAANLPKGICLVAVTDASGQATLLKLSVE